MIGTQPLASMSKSSALNEVPSQLMSLIDRANNSVDIAQSTQEQLDKKLAQIMRPACGQAESGSVCDPVSVELSPLEYQLINIIARIDSLSNLNRAIMDRLPL
jgi:hypothetical protein